MEHYDVKDLTLRLFTELLDEPELAQLQRRHRHPGLPEGLARGRGAHRSHGRRSARRRSPCGWSRARTGTPRPCRPAAEGWPVPVFEHKAETDANFERCVRLLHDHHGEVRAAFGSHNLRSLAYAVTYARAKGIPDTGYELQMLHGMAEPIHAAIRRLGLRLRVYAPVGELVPGMAYLVRRLLENTSNESFVRARFADGKELDELVEAPRVDHIPDPEPPAHRGRDRPRSSWRLRARAACRVASRRGARRVRRGGRRC